MSSAPVAIGFPPAALLTLVITAFLATDPSASQEKTAPKAYRDHQVPAGTYLAIELRTEMSSNSSRKADDIEGRLLRAVSNDGVELLPEGSVVRGTVREVEPAGKKKPGRLVFSFHVVEHPETGSLATIRTRELEYESVPPEKGKIFPELRVEKGTQVFASLLAPLTVRIPKEKG